MALIKSLKNTCQKQEVFLLSSAQMTALINPIPFILSAIKAGGGF
jgi:hypothetical protein